MWQCNSCICGVGLWRPRNCRTACGHSAQRMAWLTLLECIAPLRTPVLVGDHGCVPAHVGTLCTSVHLLVQTPKNHRGRRPPLARLGAHSLFIAIVPPPIATKTLAQFRASPNCIQLEFGPVARICGLWPTVAAGNNMPKVETYLFDSCRWWHQDPGNGKLYRMRHPGLPQSDHHVSAGPWRHSAGLWRHEAQRPVREI